MRGVPFQSFLRALHTLVGSDGVGRTLARLPPELAQAAQRGQLRASEWYPLAWYRALHAAAQEVSGGNPQLARAIGRETMRHDMSGFFRVLLRLASPQLLLARAPRVYAQYFSEGSLEVAESGPGHARVLWKGCRGFDDNLWEDMIGSVEVAMAATGARDVRVSIPGRPTGPTAPTAPTGNGPATEAPAETPVEMPVEMFVRWS
jgi:uncharacterized protein (TIGR02265 family)